ncbi:hypothetical protein B0T24DRAFT_295914 [Lasiosphaeria ovina]|uniref:Uncharacterized protein n=1 Tax=Lasiosphaeria ovina TaxID=92902 RepID=A0AAE0KDZ7_9PEZI|nr:hypothetical protein B0T24DRAFT_295914 [Lasiosphaeria ovina]
MPPRDPRALGVEAYALDEAGVRDTPNDAHGVDVAFAPRPPRPPQLPGPPFALPPRAPPRGTVRPFIVRCACAGALSMVFSWSLLSSCSRLTPSHYERLRRMEGRRPEALPVDIGVADGIDAAIAAGTDAVEKGAMDRATRGSGAKAVEPRGLPRRALTRSNS